MPYTPLDSRNPRLHDPCRMPLMIPRDRAGQDSMARAAPAGHSAPMPMPSSARKRNRNQKLGAKPAMKLQSEYHAIEIISGVLRPTRSASQPDPHAPTRRIHSVIVKTAVTSVKETPNSLAIGTMISRNTVKSNASRVQPNQPAHQASHWSLVGSFHQGIALAVPAAVVMARTSFMPVGRGERRHDDGGPGRRAAPYTVIPQRKASRDSSHDPLLLCRKARRRSPVAVDREVAEMLDRTAGIRPG